MTAQIILSLSILVGLHELGHLVAAKVFNMRVEKYSIGFPPKIFGVKWGETEYSIGAIPLGGYVKISGMIDESLDTEAMSAEPKDYEFRSKPAWQRLIVMMGGIFVNVVTGVIIFINLTYFVGEVYTSKDEVNKHGIYSLDLGQELGLRTGDKIIRINLPIPILGESPSLYDLVPEAIEFRDSLPKTSTGKIDKPALVALP